MDRRDFLKLAALAGVSAALLPGCMSKPAPAPTPRADVGHAGSSSGPAAAADMVIAEGKDPAATLDKGLRAMGGIERFVKAGNTVVLKPNFSVPRLPEEASTTNPELVAALVRTCLGAGAAAVKVIDYPFTSAVICLEKTGIKKAATAAGAQVYALNGGRDRYFRAVNIGGRELAVAEFSKDVLEADVFINMPILKDHVGTRLTMGLKNMMGLVWDRGHFHRTDLNRCIAELATFKKPHLSILDAFRGITDNGPTGPGTIREWGQLVLGTDMLAVDAYGAELFGVKPAEVGYLPIAAELGVGQLVWSKLNVKQV
jgi:uncharacterized protein (DUF362 family)